ncbi:hypothetical protein PM082_010545 [Marasmius tenuissimus]|nr:hypothetical protein PM082_010545 [Marasmius tenuissimus]
MEPKPELKTTQLESTTEDCLEQTAQTEASGGSDLDKVDAQEVEGGCNGELDADLQGSSQQGDECNEQPTNTSTACMDEAADADTKIGADSENGACLSCDNDANNCIEGKEDRLSAINLAQASTEIAAAPSTPARTTEISAPTRSLTLAVASRMIPLSCPTMAPTLSEVQSLD